jgi:hypothetical protein
MGASTLGDVGFDTPPANTAMALTDARRLELTFTFPCTARTNLASSSARYTRCSGA